MAVLAYSEVHDNALYNYLIYFNVRAKPFKLYLVKLRFSNLC